MNLPREEAMMHYWQEVVKVMEITGRNPSSRIKDSQIRGRRFLSVMNIKGMVNVHYLFGNSNTHGVSSTSVTFVQ